MKLRTSVIGLGKLGASMAAAMASRGIEVVGADCNSASVDAINTGLAPVQETDLQNYISENRARLRATVSTREAVHDSDISFVIVPTPSQENGAFSTRYAEKAFAEIGAALSDKDSYHLVALTSTVLPGVTRSVLLPILEQTSGKSCGKDFGLCYSPEFIALGSVIHDFLNPDFTLVGEYDSRSGDVLEACYRAVMENDPVCARMSIENAELAKIAVNTYVTTKITFANMLADLCERIPNGDVDVVSHALGMDRRIGRRYLTGALGYGGPCFPRDNVALTYLANQLGVDASIPQATDRVNRALSSKMVEEIEPILKDVRSAAVLGLAYKPDSHVIEESHGINLCKALHDRGLAVSAWDDLAREEARKQLPPDIRIPDDLGDAVQDADIVFITIPDRKFQPAIDLLGSHGHSVVAIDFWRKFANDLESRDCVRYVPYGRNVDPDAAALRMKTLWH